MHNQIRKAIIALELLVGVCALFGGAALLIRTDGSLLRFDVASMNGVFTSFFWPGLVLTALGALQTLAAWEMRKHTRYATTLSAAAGAATVFWIAAQVVFVGPLSPQQVFFTLVGLALYTLAMELVHEGEGPHWLPTEQEVFRHHGHVSG